MSVCVCHSDFLLDSVFDVTLSLCLRFVTLSRMSLMFLSVCKSDSLCLSLICLSVCHSFCLYYVTLSLCLCLCFLSVCLYVCPADSCSFCVSDICPLSFCLHVSVYDISLIVKSSCSKSIFKPIVCIINMQGWQMCRDANLSFCSYDLACEANIAAILRLFRFSSCRNSRVTF